MRHWLWLTLGVAVATLGLTCAPREDNPAPGGKKGGGSAIIPKDLKDCLEATLREIKGRPLEPGLGFWTIFHAILGMGLDTELVVGEDDKRVKAIDYIMDDARDADGRQMPGRKFIPTFHGVDVESVVNQGPGFMQGHQDQFIAEMAQWGLPPEAVFKIDDEKRTFLDFCKHSRMRASVKAKPKQELSWAIIIIGQHFGEGDLFKKNAQGAIEYLPWKNERGEKLTYEDVVRHELGEPIEGAACGGTHRLFGLTWGLHLHLRRGGKITGVWKEVAEHLRRYKELAREHQNRVDHSFSTKYFSQQPRGEQKVAEERIATTGHILEWLALTLSDEELNQDWMRLAVRAQCVMVLELQGDPATGGSLYHATHGLNLYHARVFGGPNDPRLRPVPLPPK